MSSAPTWNIRHLREHLQYAIDLEFWTIPYYMSAMYSIVDRASTAFQYIQSVVNQEMLHVQLAANVANAYGLSPKFAAPVYDGTIPHLNFQLDHPNPTRFFSPYSAEIGPLDSLRINGMCLVEYPDWVGFDKPNLCQNVNEYPNIGAFYQAVAYGASQLVDHLRGGVNQIDIFRAYYRNMPSMIVSDSGAQGFNQADLLLTAITEQGEGISRARKDIASSFQNTATDAHPQLSHFEKFSAIRDNPLPATYPVKDPSRYSREDKHLLVNLDKHFRALRHALEELFAGKNPPNFMQYMVTVGADIQTCWKHGVTPRFD